MTRIAYASVTDVQTRLSFVATFSATSQPNATQVHGHLVNASNELDAVIQLANYDLPIPDTATAAIDQLRTWTGVGAALFTAKSMPQGRTGFHVENLETEWNAILHRLSEGELELIGLDKSSTAMSVRGPGSGDAGSATPYFSKWSGDT